MENQEIAGVHNLKTREYVAKETHAWIAIIAWIGYGIYAILTKKIDGFVAFLIFYTVYFTVGFLIASLASILTFFPMYFLDKLHDKYRLWWIGLITMILTPIALIGTIVWVIFIANSFLGITNSFFGSSQNQNQTQTSSTIPAQYQDDKKAFIDSIIALNKARDLTQPENGIIGSSSKEKDREILSLVGHGLFLGSKVSDEFLDYLNPELKNIYRNKLIEGAEIWQEGIKTSNLQKQIEGAKLDEEWLNWFNEHKEDVGDKVF